MITLILRRLTSDTVDFTQQQKRTSPVAEPTHRIIPKIPSPWDQNIIFGLNCTGIDTKTKLQATTVDAEL